MRNAYHRQNEGDPHKEVEATKDVVKCLLPVLCRRRTDGVLAILQPALNDGIVQAVGRVGGVAGVDLFWGDEVDIDARDSIGWIRASPGLGRQLPFIHPNGKGSISTKPVERAMNGKPEMEDLPDLNAIAGGSIPRSVGPLELHRNKFAGIVELSWECFIYRSGTRAVFAIQALGPMAQAM